MKTSETLVDLPRSGCLGQFTTKVRMYTKTVQKNPRATSQTLQASVSKLNVKAHDSKIRKGCTSVHECGLFGRVARRKFIFSKKNRPLSRLLLLM